MVRETGVQSQVESYQRLKKQYLMPVCLTLNNIIRYGSRVSWTVQGMELCPPLHLDVISLEKGAFVSHSTTVCQLTYLMRENFWVIIFFYQIKQSSPTFCPFQFWVKLLWGVWNAWLILHWITKIRKSGEHLRTATLDSCFDLIRSHQCRNSTTEPPVHIAREWHQINTSW